MFVIKTRNGDIKIDSDEVALFEKAALEDKATMIRFRQGYVLTSAIITIVEDVDRKQKFIERCVTTPPHVIGDWRKDRLPDIFDGVPRLNNEIKKIG